MADSRRRLWRRDPARARFHQNQAKRDSKTMNSATCRQSPSLSDFAGPLRRPFKLYGAGEWTPQDKPQARGRMAASPRRLRESTWLQRPGQGALGFGGQLRLVAADEMRAQRDHHDRGNADD